MFIQKKLAASGIHFLLSLTAFSIFVLVLLYAWFPEPFFTASGGIQGLKIVILVDLVLGPLLTFVVFDLNKPRAELLRDLSIIALLQLSALIWGIYAMSGQRPVALVFWEHEFYTVPYSALDQHYTDTAEFQKLADRPRQLIYAEKPTSLEGIEAMLQRVNDLDLPPHHQIELYHSFEEGFALAKQHQVDIQEIIQHNPDMQQQLRELLQSKNQAMDELIYLGLKSRYRNIVLVFNPAGENIGFIEAPLKETPE
jgi:hypothetical protein